MRYLIMRLTYVLLNAAISMGTVQASNELCGTKERHMIAVRINSITIPVDLSSTTVGI